MSANRSTRNVLCLVATLAELAVVVALVHGALQWLVFGHGRLWRHPYIPDNLRRAMVYPHLERRSDRTSVLLVGASGVREGFDAKRMARDLGPGADVFNAGISGGLLTDTYMYLRYIERAGPPERLPDVVVVGLLYAKFPDAAAQHPNGTFSAGMLRSAEAFHEVGGDHVLTFEDRAQMALESVSDLYRHRRTLVPMCKVFVYDGVRLAGAVLGDLPHKLYVKLIGRPPRRFDAVANYHTDAAPADYMAKHRVGTRRRLDPRRYHFPNVQTRALEQSLAWCEQHRVRAILVLLPEDACRKEMYTRPEQYETFRAFVADVCRRHPNACLLDCRDVLAPDEFYDTVHANRFGRQRLTDLVTHRILDRAGAAQIARRGQRVY